MTVPRDLTTMDVTRKRDYRDNLDFYEGKQWDWQLSQLRPRERRLTLNYAKTLIDKTTSYLMSERSVAIEPITSSTAPPKAGQERARRSEEALETAWNNNQLNLLDFDTEIDTAILGDGAFKVTWDVTQQRVQVSTPDVQTLFAWPAAHDPTELIQVAQQYQQADKVTVTEIWTAGSFQLWHDHTLMLQELNPYGFIPYVVFPNLRRPKQFWGESDINQIRESQREINREISVLSMIMELSGNPIAVLENVESSQDVEIKPGAIWEIPEKAKAYLIDLLSGGGVQLHIAYVDLLYRTLHDLGEAPRTAFGDNQRNLSGVALEVELQPLLHKVNRKRLIRTAVYIRRNQMILKLIEQFTGASFGPLRHRIIWGQITPKDNTVLIAQEKGKVQAALHSRRRAMDNLGVQDPEAELTQWLAEEKQIRALDQPIRLRRTEPPKPDEPTDLPVPTLE